MNIKAKAPLLRTASQAVQQLLNIMIQLRHPTCGCPWDIQQDYQSILSHTLEEAYEVADAIEAGDFNQLQDELGDLLFQIMFYCQMAHEEGRFSFADVAGGLADKLVRRHPHVFNQNSAIQELDKMQVMDQWEATKQQEREQKQQLSALDDVPTALPALNRAAKLQQRAANVGFDWSNTESVLDKVAEEFDELRKAIKSDDKHHMAAELGDLMFTTVNLARHLKLHPETVVRGANSKFEQRFRFVEQTLMQQGSSCAEANMTEMGQAWNLAKQSGL
jgi:nucleoside triphosphate diphosphatase